MHDQLARFELLEELGRSPYHVLYRARRPAEPAPLLVKSPRSRPAQAHEIELLEREHALLQELALPALYRPLALETDARGCLLLLEDAGLVPLRSLVAARQGQLEFFFQLARALGAGLVALHQREVTHRNLHPGSILVDPAGAEAVLGDLCFAARGAGEFVEVGSEPLWRDRLPYLAPELSGRMNRSSDQRSDFYSLGIIFYELLTGAPPFDSEDALELIHWHIAKQPIPPRDLSPAIPVQLSRLVMKLLSKTAEERYQSAAGLQYDLELCAQGWREHGAVAEFALGARDVSDHLLIPQKLYGREREVGGWRPPSTASAPARRRCCWWPALRASARPR